MHVEQSEWKKDQERDDFLQNFELSQAHCGVASPIRGNLEQIFEKCDSPAQDRGDVPFFVTPIPQMRIPGERHEYVRAREQEHCAKNKKPSHNSITSVLLSCCLHNLRSNSISRIVGLTRVFD